MNYKYLTAVLLISTFLLGGCENESEAESSNVSDKVLETNVFNLEYKDAEVIQSPMENSKGVYLTFDLTNTSDDSIVPNDILFNYLAAAQTTDTSVVYLNEPYHTLDAFGEDNESYNEMIDKEEVLFNELLPGKTIEVSYAFYLEDEDSFINLIVYNAETDEEADSYEIELD